MTAEQLRAARAMVRLDQGQLAGRSGVSVETVKRLERLSGELTSTRVATVRAIRGALESMGVRFVDNGVVYDPTSGSGGFLANAHELLRDDSDGR